MANFRPGLANLSSALGGGAITFIVFDNFIKRLPTSISIPVSVTIAIIAFTAVSMLSKDSDRKEIKIGVELEPKGDTKLSNIEINQGNKDIIQIGTNIITEGKIEIDGIKIN